MDLSEFLAARLDEDEAAAREAADRDSGQWFMGDKWNVYRAEDEARFDEDYQGDEHALVVYGNVESQSQHIARHDPARILREVEAKRKIVAEHAMEPGFLPPSCSRCYETDDDWEALLWPCPTIRALASVYSDHPDYDETWRP